MSTLTAESPVTSRPNARLESLLSDAMSRLDVSSLRKQYIEQDEFVVVDQFLPSEVEELIPKAHRNFIPKHKKGGSVGYNTVHEFGPSMRGGYHSPAVQSCLSGIAGSAMKECPASDLHRCALYCYTEEGDHVGWHYDTSYYKDTRWTVLIGLRDESSSRLDCRLYTRQKGREPKDLSLRVETGMMVLFNGDTIYHAVTPVKAGEQRHIISMQDVKTGEMNPFMRFVSNMKDSVAYFGLRQVFLGKKK